MKFGTIIKTAFVAGVLSGACVAAAGTTVVQKLQKKLDAYRLQKLREELNEPEQDE